ncbi:hypothetical protein B0G75_11511 [Paraburkholderia sp. BL18I3N2]|nr:hypothetical protein B0G75_11511 [Paraburkholderia sp. BL18I3N2]
MSHIVRQAVRLGTRLAPDAARFNPNCDTAHNGLHHGHSTDT